MADNIMADANQLVFGKATDVDKNGYTYLEIYFNELVKKVR